jgi:ERCC4-type nuclease
MQLLIDLREPNSLVNLIISLNEAETKNKITIIQKNLDNGDYVFYDEINDKPLLIVERKSLSDLESSIKDGRYKEQSFRLNELPIHNHNIIYLLEGAIINYKDVAFRSTLYSTLFSLNYYKGFSVINTLNQIETATMLIAFGSKLMRENKPCFYSEHVTNVGLVSTSVSASTSTENSCENYIATLKTSKKSHINRENIFQLMLMQIPGISSASALALSNEYKTMENLLQSLKDENANASFENIKLASGRKLNKNIIASLKQYIS